MTEKQINKWLRRQFTVIGWIMVGYYLLMNLLVSLTAVVDVMKQLLWNAAMGIPLMDLDMDALVNNGWGYVVTMAVGIFVLLAWKGDDYWKQELFTKDKKMTWGVFGFSILFCMGSQMLSSIWMTLLELVMNLFGSSMMPMLESVSGSSTSFSMFLYAAVLAPVSEELLFRGYVLRSLRPYGKRFAILGSALFFGLFHGNIIQGPYAFLAGLILGWLACEYSINWAIALHIFNNLILAEGLNRITELLPVMAADLVFLALFGSSLVAAIVVLYRKRGEIAWYRYQEWMDRRCIKCLLTNSGFLVFTLMMLASMAAWLFV